MFINEDKTKEVTRRDEHKTTKAHQSNFRCEEAFMRTRSQLNTATRWTGGRMSNTLSEAVLDHCRIKTVYIKLLKLT